MVWRISNLESRRVQKCSTRWWISCPCHNTSEISQVVTKHDSAKIPSMLGQGTNPFILASMLSNSSFIQNFLFKVSIRTSLLQHSSSTRTCLEGAIKWHSERQKWRIVIDVFIFVWECNDKTCLDIKCINVFNN